MFLSEIKTKTIKNSEIKTSLAKDESHENDKIQSNLIVVGNSSAE